MDSGSSKDFLTASGADRSAWTAAHMPLLQAITKRFTTTGPFEGLTIGVSLHLEPKTAVLLRALQAGGASIVAAGNHGSTQDDIVAYLESCGIDARGHRDQTLAEHRETVASVIDDEPDLLLDNGADLAALAVSRRLPVRGGTEETTSGRYRLDEELSGKVDFPVIVINDSPLKAIVENKHAVGQSVVESFQRITNLMPQGKAWTVVGYGWCGRGIAHYARSLGARVSVVEVDEIKRLEAAMDGFRVDSIANLMPTSDVVITATGRPGVVGPEELTLARGGILLANAGHFDTEIDMESLRAIAANEEGFPGDIQRFVAEDGRTIDVVAEGRMMNLAGIEPKGNSIESMDMGFALQALSLERLATARGTLDPGPQPVPDDINRRLAADFVDLMMGTSRG